MTNKIDRRAVGAFAAAMVLLASTASAAGTAPGESDRFHLEEAGRACAEHDFAAFVWPFANSGAVRERHSAANVRVTEAGKTRDVPAKAYLGRDDFPIAMIDYSYVTGPSIRAFEAPGGGDPALLAYVQVDFAAAPGGRQRADWTEGRFEPGEGDGPGTLIERTGTSGSLIFEPAGGCWRLVEDIRNPPRPVR
ncbi:hypothetical protein FHR22_003361 [Sphingopyxis panaciterrae]|uniref:hypothetical protein n=1 Tax=Sphingopyxis panaciterrae TaxID=363841 RepID=UPI0014242920|nr:hypothetical protein [Sphingopyxis panaciterrae]NIJ38637.1 hypothetical protein [Sphingopyxis panaciterrae]